MPDKPITFQNVLELGENNRARVKKCCAKNKDYTVTIWLDELSMLRDVVPEYVKMKSPHDLSTFPSTVKMLYEKIDEVRRVRRPGENPTVDSFRSFAEGIGARLQFLGSDLYTHLVSADVPDTHPLRKERVKRFELLAIVLRKVRRRNWGGASNVSRVLLLIERPGVYIDHDNTVGHLGQLYGFRYALSAHGIPLNSFLASAYGYPLLRAYRTVIAESYPTKDLKDKFTLSMDQMPPQPPKLPKEPTLVQSLYIMETQLRPSGPLGFAKFFGDCLSSRIPLPGLIEPGGGADNGGRAPDSRKVVGICRLRGNMRLRQLKC